LELELLLAKKEEELADARFFSTAVDMRAQSSTAITQSTSKAITGLTPSAPMADQPIGSPIDHQALLRDLGTRSDRDPRSFAEKANDLLAGGVGSDSVAIVSQSVVDLAGNPEVLPDHELEALYQQQGNPDIKRVVAQVLSTRGDNRLLEKQIMEAQAGLKSDAPAERQRALVQLGKTRYAGAANAIAPLLDDADNSVKLDALLALRATGNQSHLRQVEALVSHPDPAVSWLAKDVVNTLQNLSEKARTQLGSADILAELPAVTAP
jgi:hypothetical protein